MLRALLFDFDGTIADTEPLHFAAFAEVLAPRGVRLDRERYYQRYLALTDGECLERIVRDFARPDLEAAIAELLREKHQAMARRLAAGVPLCAGVERFLAELAPGRPLAIVSGALRVEVEDVLERAGLANRFDVLVTAEDVPAGKPDPAGYRLGWRRLRERLADLEPPECLAVEDAPKGIDAARAAGLRTLALAHSLPPAALSGADLLAATFDAVDRRELFALFSAR